MQILREFAQLYCLLQDMDMVDPDTVSSSFQQKLTTTQVVYIHMNISSKTQVAFLIASEYYIHLLSDVQSLYTIMETSRKLQN